MNKGNRTNQLKSTVTRMLLALLALFMLAGQTPAEVSETVTYFHTDGLGSVIAATDESGNLLWRERYRPFGNRLEKAVTTDEHALYYTGKPHDDATGLTYFGARHYDPVGGRFMGIDPVGVDPANMHSFNRYAYANNNPYKYVDPDGRAVFLAPVVVFLAKELAGEAFEQATGVPALFSVKGVAKAVRKELAKSGGAAVEGAAKRGLGNGRNTSRSFDTGGPTTSRPASFPQGNSQTQHIFRDAPGHLADTPANRKLLQGVANDSRTTLGTDRFGNSWSARTRSDGSQVWVQTRNGVIQNGGVNSTPRSFNPQTGLSGR